MHKFCTAERPKNLMFLFSTIIILASFSFAQIITPEIYQNLEYRYIGPPGNRTSAVVGIPGDPLTY